MYHVKTDLYFLFFNKECGEWSGCEGRNGGHKEIKL